MADTMARLAERVPERLLLRPAETAEVIGMSRSKTYELIGSGAIPSICIGKSRRVPVDGLRR